MHSQYESHSVLLSVLIIFFYCVWRGEEHSQPEDGVEIVPDKHKNPLYLGWHMRPDRL
jgi:hypothetical protein